MKAIKIGHGSVNTKLAKLGLKENSLCPNCGMKETVQHIIWECPEYDNLRHESKIAAENLRDRKDLYKLINTEEKYNKFNDYIQEVYKIRQW